MNVKHKNLLDCTGLAILRELQSSGRISYRELGRKVGLSAPAVIDRIRRMENEGIIKGYGARIDPQKAGFPLRALSAMSTDFKNPDPYIAEKIHAIPEVIRCWSVTGENDYYIEILARSMEDLERILGELTRLGKLCTSVILSSMEKSVLPEQGSSNLR
jgi:Lrp/AsnC family leucine-responsive transcriptional regulator